MIYFFVLQWGRRRWEGQRFPLRQRREAIPMLRVANSSLSQNLFPFILPLSQTLSCPSSFPPLPPHRKTLVPSPSNKREYPSPSPPPSTLEEVHASQSPSSSREGKGIHSRAHTSSNPRFLSMLQKSIFHRPKGNHSRVHTSSNPGFLPLLLRSKSSYPKGTHSRAHTSGNSIPLSLLPQSKSTRPNGIHSRVHTLRDPDLPVLLLRSRSNGPKHGSRRRNSVPEQTA